VIPISSEGAVNVLPKVVPADYGISHTLSALQVLTRRNLDVAAVVVSESEGSAAALDETVAAIARFADTIDVVGIPRLADPATAHPAFAAIAQLL